MLAILYSLSGILSALCLVAIAVLILAQVAGRSANVLIRGADDLVAWFTAATTFLGLPYAFWRGAHIRVELVVANISPVLRRPAQLLAHAIALAITGSFAWASVAMVWESFLYDELSMGQLVVPMWLPQSALAIGASILFVAVIDATAQVLVRARPGHAGDRAASPPLMES